MCFSDHYDSFRAEWYGKEGGEEGGFILLYSVLDFIKCILFECVSV